MPDFDLPHDPRLDREDRPLGRFDRGFDGGGGLPVDGAPDGATAGGGAAGFAVEPGPFVPPTRLSARPPGTGIALLQIAACSGFPTQILITVLLALAGFQPPADPSQWSLGYVAAVLLLDSIVVVSLVLLFLRLHGDRPLDVFLGMQPVLGEVVRGVLLVPVVFALIGTIALLVQRYAPWLHLETNPFQILVRAPHGILVVGALSILVGGLREEIQRAFVLHRFTQIGIPMIGLFVFSVLFGLGHAVQGWDAVIMTGALGATWGLVYLRRRSLVAPAVCHGLFDVIQVAALSVLA